MKETQSKKPNLFLRLITFLVTLALILGAVALVVYRDRINLDALQRWLNYRGLETGETGEAAPFSYGGGSSVDIACLNGALLFSSNNGVRLYSNSGIQLANEVLTLENPVLAVNERLGVAYDMGGRELRAYDGQGQVFSLTLDEGYGILSARPNNAGWLAVTVQQSGYKGVVAIYNNHFEPQMELRYSSVFVLDAALSGDSGQVAVAAIATGGSSFESQLLLYTVGQEEALATLSLGNTAVLDLSYSGQTIRVLGEQSLSLFSNSGASAASYSFSDRYLKGYDLSGDQFSLLLLGRYRAGSADQVLAVADDGTVLFTLSPEGQILDLSANGRYFSLLSADRLDIYDVNDQSLYASLQGTQGARFVSLREDGTALLADTEHAWLYLP